MSQKSEARRRKSEIRNPKLDKKTVNSKHKDVAEDFSLPEENVYKK